MEESDRLLMRSFFMLQGRYKVRRSQMAKGKTSVFFCQECGYESAKWMGQCPGCHAWNTFVEEKVEKNSPARKRAANEVTVSTLSQIETREEMRITTDIEELD